MISRIRPKLGRLFAGQTGTKLRISGKIEHWPIAGEFRLSRERRKTAQTLVAQIHLGKLFGRGESVPYSHFGETPAAALDDLSKFASRHLTPDSWISSFESLETRAAKCAIDAAFWDLAARHSRQPVWAILGLPPPKPVVTAFTISLDAPRAMFSAARAASFRPLLKIKLGEPETDDKRIRLVREASPEARLIVDANEGWSLTDLQRLAPVCAEAGVELIEQPIAARSDAALQDYDSPVPLCADESFLDPVDLPKLKPGYAAVNVKLDKSGGLSHALHAIQEARAAGFEIMLGCMVSTSLAIAPAFLLAPMAKWVDLDGPILLTTDRTGGVYEAEGCLNPPSPDLWGGAPADLAV